MRLSPHIRYPFSSDKEIIKHLDNALDIEEQWNEFRIRLLQECRNKEVILEKEIEHLKVKITAQSDHIAALEAVGRKITAAALAVWPDLLDEKQADIKDRSVMYGGR